MLDSGENKFFFQRAALRRAHAKLHETTARMHAVASYTFSSARHAARELRPVDVQPDSTLTLWKPRGDPCLARFLLSFAYKSQHNHRCAPAFHVRTARMWYVVPYSFSGNGPEDF